jgi:hypothetical protein
MKTLSMILLLIAGTVHAEMTLQAPQTAVVGELVRFESSGSDEVAWKCIQETSDFEAIGPKAFFSARQTGTYTFVLAGIVDEKPVILTHTLVVSKDSKPEPPKPPAPNPPAPNPPAPNPPAPPAPPVPPAPNPPAPVPPVPPAPKPDPPKPAPVDLSQVEVKLKEVAPADKEAGPKLAQCFRALAESAVPADQMLAETVAGLKRATADDPKWTPYLEVLAAYVDTLDLKTREDFKREWPKLATIVERSLQ